MRSRVEFTAAHEEVTLGIGANKPAFMVHELRIAHGTKLPPVLLARLGGRPLLPCADHRVARWQIGSGHVLFSTRNIVNSQGFSGDHSMDFTPGPYYSSQANPSSSVGGTIIVSAAGLDASDTRQRSHRGAKTQAPARALERLSDAARHARLDRALHRAANVFHESLPGARSAQSAAEPAIATPAHRFAT
jgi:hypothetical protein